MVEEDALARVRAVKSLYESNLMDKANVIGVGIGLRRVAGRLTDEPALIVSVTHKVPLSRLAARDVIPRELNGVPVDVQAVGELRAF
jgi:hypothetical protein